MTLITVVVPFYKKREHIIYSIKSILKQSYKNFEIIIVYDDEDLHDFKYVKKLANLDKRIKILRNKKNIGAGESRNKAIKNSRGNYIAFLDADDIWYKDKLKRQINFMKKNKLIMSYTSYKIINDENKIIGHRKAKRYLNYTDLLKDCEIGLSTVMIKRNLLKDDIKFPNLKTKEDFTLWLKISKITKIFGIKTSLCYWRDTKNSLSKNVLQKLLDGYKVYRVHMNMSIIKSTYYLFMLSINYLKKTNKV